MIRRTLCAFFGVFLLAAGTLDGQEGFKPLSELPPGQELPAAPFLIGAYIFIWVALMAYLWSIWRRLGKVEKEMRALEQRSNRGSTR
jgi:CcmD family protein